MEHLRALGDAARDDVPALWAVFAPWDATIRGALGRGAVRGDAREALLSLARAVPY